MSPDITYQCNKQEKVMTAWALVPDDKAKIFARFILRSLTSQKTLLARITENSLASALAEADPETRSAFEEDVKKLEKQFQTRNNLYKTELILQKQTDLGHNFQMQKVNQQLMDIKSRSSIGQWSELQKETKDLTTQIREKISQRKAAPE